jgi:hypothetical protein
MSQTSDDLDAVRAIVKALEAFEPSEQERILRWAREKIGLSTGSTVQERPIVPADAVEQVPSGKTPVNIKEFLNIKQPKSDNHLAATVAYYYRFEAPVNERREAITKDDLLNACRLADWERPNHPAQVLVNSQGAGLLNKGSEKGSYVISSVGENLVAVALPAGIKARTPKKATKRRKK